MQIKLTSWWLVILLTPLVVWWLIANYCWPWMYEDALNFWESLMLVGLGLLVETIANLRRKIAAKDLRREMNEKGLTEERPMKPVPKKSAKDAFFEEIIEEAKSAAKEQAKSEGGKK